MYLDRMRRSKYFKGYMYDFIIYNLLYNCFNPSKSRRVHILQFVSISRKFL